MHMAALHPKMALLMVYENGIAMTAPNTAYKIRPKNSKKQSSSLVVVILNQPSMLWMQAAALSAQDC